MDFFLSKIISRPLRGGDDNCDKLTIASISSRIEYDVETITAPTCDDDNTVKRDFEFDQSNLIDFNWMQRKFLRLWLNMWSNFINFIVTIG